jgi:5-methylcytosine-specific restriction endonuclease McrA
LKRRRELYAEGKRRKDYKTSPDVRRRIKNRRRAKLAKTISQKYSSKEIFEKYDFKCCYCGEQATCLDHVFPISRGGPDIASNLVASCGPCNSSKGSKLINEWKGRSMRVN